MITLHTTDYLKLFVRMSKSPQRDLRIPADHLGGVDPEVASTNYLV